MPVSSRYVLQQGPMLATLGKTAAIALTQRMRRKRNGTPHAPSPEVARNVAPPSPQLMDAFVRHLGGEPRAYRDIVPPHLFPQWVLPVAAETLAGISYPLLRVLNAGCRMQINAPLPRGERLEVRAQLANVDDDGKRALLTQRVVTGTASSPNALVTEIHALVPLARDKSDGARKERPRVPDGAREIAFLHLSADEGLSFAKLTGDFNPIHWIRPYAKAAGFRSVILHGFGTFARSVEALNRGVFGGDVHKLRVLEARFTRPLVLPHDVGFYVSGREFFVGDAPLGPAYLTGHFETVGEA
ncbi:MAG TPA: MaoC/PaaZ C-terminal domain-containing protein [Polyangiales bacterium]|nr:MaoC/PaaZ C-terminal domain-containing protein [Polyangiales bacterium]